MKKNIIFIFLLLIIILIIIMALEDKNIKKGKACFKDRCFDVILSVSFEDKRKGLMHKESIKDNEGMLFVYDNEGIYSFWMKNVNFPLDIIWVNNNKEVVFISRNSSPCLKDSCPSINPGIKAKYVLEIKGGISEKLGLDLGDKLDIVF